jgi:hypothetical protein
VGSERDAVMKRCSCGYLPLPDATRCPKCGAVVVRESAGFHDAFCREGMGLPGGRHDRASPR